MPIADYKKRALRAEKKLMESLEIPEQSKRVLQRFLIAYDVSEARKHIFLTKIGPLLTEFNPIESALTERDRINELFARLPDLYKFIFIDAPKLNLTHQLIPTVLHLGRNPVGILFY